MDFEGLIISSAKVETNSRSEFPEVEASFSFENFERFILDSRENFNLLCEKIRKIELDSLSIRFNVWRILLGQIKVNDSDEDKRKSITQDRENYRNLWEKYKPKTSSASGSQEPAKPKPVFNPLAKNVQNSPWNGYFEDNELRSDIKKDVDRTYQDKPFFSNLKVKAMLINILFVFCKKNADVSYRQGMNELAASFMLVYFTEALFVQRNSELLSSRSSRSLQNARHMLDLTNAEADIFSLFERMMELGQLEMFRPYLTESHRKKEEYNVNSKKQQAILIRIAKIQDHYLKLVDLELFKHMKLLNVEFQVFLLRWIRCMHTREYHLDDSFSLWDNIYLEYYMNPSKDNDFFLIDCICLAMMQYVRAQLLEKEEQTECLQRFLKYPPVENLKPIVDVAFKIKDIINKGISEKEITLGKNNSNNLAQESMANQTKQGKSNPILFSAGFTDAKSNSVNLVQQQQEQKKNVIVEEKKQKKFKGGLFKDEVSSSDSDNEQDQQVKKQDIITKDQEKDDKEEEEDEDEVQEKSKKKKQSGNKRTYNDSDSNEDSDEEQHKQDDNNSRSSGFPVASFGKKDQKTNKSDESKKIEERKRAEKQKKRENDEEKRRLREEQEKKRQEEEEQRKKAQRKQARKNSDGNTSEDEEEKEDGNYQQKQNQEDQEVNPFTSASVNESTTKQSVSLENVTFRPSEYASILRKLSSSDTKNDNMRKALEDLQSVERELKSKQQANTKDSGVIFKDTITPTGNSNNTSNPLQSRSQVIQKGFKLAAESKNKPILFTS